MKHKTSELEGVLLDAAVAKAGGAKSGHGGFWLWPAGGGLLKTGYTPSSNWCQGGPIIERECIWLSHIPFGAESEPPFWCAHLSAAVADLVDPEGGPLLRRSIDMTGATPLIASMRAFVARNLGNEVELP